MIRAEKDLNNAFQRRVAQLIFQNEIKLQLSQYVFMKHVHTRHRYAL